jgi:hypothetical protein
MSTHFRPQVKVERIQWHFAWVCRLHELRKQQLWGCIQLRICPSFLHICLADWSCEVVQLPVQHKETKNASTILRRGSIIPMAVLAKHRLTIPYQPSTKMGRRQDFLRKSAGTTDEMDAKSPTLVESQMRITIKLSNDLFKQPIGLLLVWMPDRKSERSLY